MFFLYLLDNSSNHSFNFTVMKFSKELVEKNSLVGADNTDWAAAALLFLVAAITEHRVVM